MRASDELMNTSWAQSYLSGDLPDRRPFAVDRYDGPYPFEFCHFQSKGSPRKPSTDRLLTLKFLSVPRIHPFILPRSVHQSEHSKLVSSSVAPWTPNHKGSLGPFLTFSAGPFSSAPAVPFHSGVDSRKAAERKATWLTDYLHTHMAHLGFDDLKNEQIRLKIKKTPPKVIVENADLIPDAYKETQVAVLIRKSLIAEDLKNGRPVPGTHLESGTRLDIR